MKNTKFHAGFFTILTLVGLISFILIPKAPKIDFDLIGIMYLIENIIPITILIITIFCGANAVKLWLKVWQSENEF